MMCQSRAPFPILFPDAWNGLKGYSIRLESSITSEGILPQVELRNVLRIGRIFSITAALSQVFEFLCGMSENCK